MKFEAWRPSHQKNPIESEGAIMIVEAIRRNTHLEELCFQQGSIGPTCSDSIG